MKILKIIHGYPPLYNAGSEVYSQLLCHGLTEAGREVHVFTREENPFAHDFSVRVMQDSLNQKVTLHIINIPIEKHRYRYRQVDVDNALEKLLGVVKPDIAHIGHLNHLSTSLISTIKKQHIPIVYTLHDYWLICPRGQFIQRNPPKNSEAWALCDKQENTKCATHCYAGYFSGSAAEKEEDTQYWTNWVARRKDHLDKVLSQVDHFISPSKYLMQRYVAETKIPSDKITYLDYGFQTKYLTGRNRSTDSFSFGYIGTHIPAKGIQHLILAFSMIKSNARLKIWGRPRSQYTTALQAIISDFPKEIQERISWMGEYTNHNIIKDVFNHVDCIVVPSIWMENSPLVIHEALQSRVAVITADVGGMAEYIEHNKNGLLFKHRNIESLHEQMQSLLDNPDLAVRLGQAGYLQSEDKNIPDIEEHIRNIEMIYQQLIQPMEKVS